MQGYNYSSHNRVAKNVNVERLDINPRWPMSGVTQSPVGVWLVFDTGLSVTPHMVMGHLGFMASH